MSPNLTSNTTAPKKLSGVSWFVLLYLAGVASLSLIATLIKALLAGL